MTAFSHSVGKAQSTQRARTRLSEEQRPQLGVSPIPMTQIMLGVTVVTLHRPQVSTCMAWTVTPIARSFILTHFHPLGTHGENKLYIYIYPETQSVYPWKLNWWIFWLDLFFNFGIVWLFFHAASPPPLHMHGVSRRQCSAQFLVAVWCMEVKLRCWNFYKGFYDSGSLSFQQDLRIRERPLLCGFLNSNNVQIWMGGYKTVCRWVGQNKFEHRKNL